MPTRPCALTRLVLSAGLLATFATTSFAADRTDETPVPDKRWSRVYLQQDVSPVEPTAPVTRYPVGIDGITAAPTNEPDVAVLPATNVTQSEISTAVDPNDPDIVFVSANSSAWPVSTFYGTGVYWSLDGGATWTGNHFGPGGVGNSGDPSVAIRGIDGRWIVGYIAGNFGQGVSYTTDHGASWSQRTIFSSGTLDKNHLTVDNVPTSPYYGNIYNAWSALGGGANANDIEFVRSTDGGATWPATTINISNNVFSGSHDQGINLQVGPDGDVNAVWAIYDSWPSDETAYGFNRSTDGGVTWTGEFRAITNIRGHRNTVLPNTTVPRRNSFPSMAVDTSNGPNRGNIYVVWTNQGVPGINTGDPDIYLARSTDHGATFGTPIRVNQDAGTATQWFPWISCDPATGQLGVIFYDRRDDPSNVQARAYMATSFDGGLTWEDFPVADVAFTPTSIPGLATGYMGDYLGLAINAGQAYPSWMDTRTGNFLCYVSPTLIADPTRPNPPTDVASYSDYQTPNSVLLNWTDPTTFPDGTPLVDFSIDILRDGLLVTNVDQGNGTYTDLGLTDGQLYDYELRTRDDVTDSLSTVVPTSVICGGSPDPGPVSAVSCSGDLTTATIDWTNPTLQADGTPLDDFAGVRIYRNGSLLVELGRAPADTGNAEQYVDTPAPGFVYNYELAAIDSETPVHESARVATGACFVGDVPSILVWKPVGLASPSADSLFAALASLGESVVLSNDLFAFGADLNVHDMVFATAGVSPDRHVITLAEGAALDSFVQDGGMLYLEGGDCFNDEAGGYNVRAIFGLNDGPSGTADLFGVTGLNDALGLSFAYSGPNNNMDELSPVSSTPIFQNSANTDRSGVFAPSYGFGRAIGVTFEFRGLVAGTATPTDLAARYLAMFRSTGTPTLFVGPTSITSSVYQNETDLQTAIVGNPGTLNASLTWSLAEAPDVPWLVVTPSAGTIPANGQTTLNLSFDATGLLPNLYTTDVVVTSNDPANPADTIAVAFDVAGIPILDVSPPMLDVSIAINDAVTDSLVFGNTGTDDLVFTLDTPGGGGIERDEFLAEDVTNTSSFARRGNVHAVTTGLVINQFEHNLTIPSATTLEFFVYESETSTGTYTKKYSTTVAAAAGSGWYSSGPINAALLPGYFYFIGCGWQGSVTATRDNAQNAPEGTSFGSILGSAAISGFPPPATQFIGQVNPAIWDQALEFGFPLDVTLQTAASGSIAPGSTHTTRLNFAAGTTLGEWTTVLTLSHNIPNQTPVLQIPIHMTVLDGTLVDSPVQIGVPIAFALHRASPNPSSDRTLIRFDLPHPARVKLDVFDVTGRRVRTLVDGPVEAGYRNVVWDGRDSGGRAVASGVYFYSLESEGHSFREKVVLLH